VLIGYARCSTADQDTDVQVRAMIARGVSPQHIHCDHGLSGAGRNRPALDNALAACRDGDTLVVTALDRLGRSVRDLHDIADELAAKGTRLEAGGVTYDPGDPMGRMFFGLLAVFAEFERELLRARTREGMRVAAQKGRLKGRPPKLSAQQRTHLRKLHAAGEHSPAEIGALLGISRSSVYRELQRAQ
jgi:DNA invertase Pin-like site-specific DNA recombinase